MQKHFNSTISLAGDIFTLIIAGLLAVVIAMICAWVFIFGVVVWLCSLCIAFPIYFLFLRKRT